jgi:cobyrinic acid a,c-diamide synthase
MTAVLVLAGVASGVGKTTLTLGLLEACRRRGLTVQAFKVGPDFIDPGFHALVTGRPSLNLDGWMCGREAVLACVARHAAGADLALVEGMMGCFDGVDGRSGAGSTAEIAAWLGAPMVLVLDASAQARSAAAVVAGFERFDPAVRVAGVILNRVGGAAHAASIAEAVRASCRAVPLGALARDDGLALPERHLGLVTAAEGVLTAGCLRRLADAVERGVDLDALLALAAGPGTRGPAGADDAVGRDEPRHAGPEGAGRRAGPPERGGGPPRARIAVARDAAFQFYYEENLARLRAAGAELTFWSPLADPAPPEADGLYFGGGYPELHARTLTANVAARQAVRDFADAGGVVYAECGGLMYLAESLEDPDGTAHPMVGVLPAAVRMRPGRLTLGYVEVTATADTPLGPMGAKARGHLFHHSTLDPVPARVPRAYRVADARGGEPRAEGYLLGRALLSYVHLHFASNPALAAGLVEACAGARV